MAKSWTGLSYMHISLSTSSPTSLATRTTGPPHQLPLALRKPHVQRQIFNCTSWIPPHTGARRVSARRPARGALRVSARLVGLQDLQFPRTHHSRQWQQATRHRRLLFPPPTTLLRHVQIMHLFNRLFSSIQRIIIAVCRRLWPYRCPTHLDSTPTLAAVGQPIRLTLFLMLRSKVDSALKICSRGLLTWLLRPFLHGITRLPRRTPIP